MGDQRGAVSGLGRVDGEAEDVAEDPRTVACQAVERRKQVGTGGFADACEPIAADLEHALLVPLDQCAEAHEQLIGRSRLDDDRESLLGDRGRAALPRWCRRRTGWGCHAYEISRTVRRMQEAPLGGR